MGIGVFKKRHYNSDYLCTIGYFVVNINYMRDSSELFVKPTKPPADKNVPERLERTHSGALHVSLST